MHWKSATGLALVPLRCLIAVSDAKQVLNFVFQALLTINIQLKRFNNFFKYRHRRVTTKLRRSILKLSQFAHYDCGMETPTKAPNVPMILKEKSNGYSSECIVENDLVLHIE